MLETGLIAKEINNRLTHTYACTQKEQGYYLSGWVTNRAR